MVKFLLREGQLTDSMKIIMFYESIVHDAVWVNLEK